MLTGGDARIRTAGPDDFDDWFRLYDAVAAEGKWIAGEAPVDRVARQHDFEAHLLDPNCTTFLVVVDDRVVGSLGVRLTGGVADLGMMVDSEFRGRGVGSALLGSCVSWAQEKGAHKVVLEVWPHNLAARHLYSKCGFVEEGRFRRHYRRRNGQLWDAIRMGLVLDNQSPGSPFEMDQV